MKTIVIAAIAVTVLAVLGGGAFVVVGVVDAQKANAAAAQKQAQVAEDRADAAEQARAKIEAAERKRKQAEAREALDKVREESEFLGFRRQIQRDIKREYTNKGFSDVTVGCQVDDPLKTYLCLMEGWDDEFGESVDVEVEAKVDLTTGGFFWESVT